MTEKIQVELTLPKGHLEALNYLTDLDPRTSLDSYVSYTIKRDIEAMLDSSPEGVGEFISSYIKALVRNE